jgi:hypothetical protein
MHFTLCFFVIVVTRSKHLIAGAIEQCSDLNSTNYCRFSPPSYKWSPVNPVRQEPKPDRGKSIAVNKLRYSNRLELLRQ